MRLSYLALFFTTLASAEITWQRQQLHSQFYSEGAGMGDINGDGKTDIVAGPFWWAGPDFTEKHSYYEPKVFDINGYSDNFFAYVHDFDADQKNDILILGFPGKEARLYLNPGAQTEDKPWPMHTVADVVDNESPVFTDITGDGKPELVCSTGGRFGWYAPDWTNPTSKWPFVAVTEDVKVAKFTHGLGVGDVDGDGHLDLLEARRWWKSQGEGVSNPLQKDLKSPSPWVPHTFATGIPGGAQMFAYDFDGNGKNDIFTSLAAHRYGVAVFLQQQTGDATWKRVMLASENPADTDYGIVFSQPHAAHLADINGDGIKDIVTGKRYWAHNGHDPDERNQRVIYWYETKRDGQGGVDFIPHLIDTQSGVGVDVQVGDLNGDSLPDVLVANKAGVFVLTQKRNQQSAIKDQKLYGPALKPQKFYAHGQSPADALKNMQLPTGFQAELVAHEPDVVQPIAFTFDERGRIWVVEGLSYPQPRKPNEGKDRIKILEDKDGDGSFETVKVFCEGINLASGIELGFGGVWVGAAPYLLFIPDRDRDDQPDGPERGTRTVADLIQPGKIDNMLWQQVPGLSFTAYALLDGFGTQDTHETLNSFLWGPDGWLYGCHGVFTHSKIGKPGTPDEQREPMNAGVWRYHPTRHVFEVYAHGTSNPWGLDYDANGEFFVTACVIPHLYHIVPGGRYHRQGGQHFNPYTYEDIQTIADHAHYAGDIRSNAHWGARDAGAIVQDDTNSAGGGHAHCGLAIYQSSQFPPEYRNRLIFGNLHGHRLVSDYVDVKGSSYVGKHGPDFMRANDMHFIPVTQKVGPDGCLYVSDWSDQQVCHRGSGAVELWDRSNGRIYRVRYGEKKAPPSGAAILPAHPIPPFDMGSWPDETLAIYAARSDEVWTARMARRILMEHAVDFEQKNTKKEAKFGTNLFNSIYCLQSPNFYNQTMWTAYAIGELDHFLGSPIVSNQEQNASVEVWLAKGIAWPIRHLNDVTQLLLYAKSASSPLIRRELASALQRLPIHQRQDLATALLSHSEDKDDPMIPLLIWYGIEPLVGKDAQAALVLAKASKLPKVTGFIYRRMAADEAGRSGLLTLAAESADAAQRSLLLSTVVQAVRAGNTLHKPQNWDALKAKLGSEQSVPELEAFMGIESALAMYRQALGSAGVPPVQERTTNNNRQDAGAPILENRQDAGAPNAGAPTRLAALDILTQVRDSASVSLLQSILAEPSSALRVRAIQALASFHDPATPAALLAHFPSYSAAEQSAAVSTLATSLTGAKAMLSAVKQKTLSSTLLSPFLARQLSTLKDPAVDALLKETFGDLNAPKPELSALKAKFKAMLPTDALASADKAKGKLLFSAICGQCHQMLGEGHAVGPDLTGSNRANLDYLLDNVLDPNALIGKAYQLNLFTLKDGRTASGILKEETPAGYRIVLPGGVEQTLTRTEVKEHSLSIVSTMPEGLFAALPQEQLQQLVAYLQSESGSRSGASPLDPRRSGASPLVVPGALEAESLQTTTTGGKAKAQGMKGFGGKWSGGQQLWWTGAKPGDSLTLTLPVAKAGSYSLSAAFTQARDYGIINVALDGKPIVSGWDGYHSPQVITTGALNWGKHELSAGEHQLTISIVGAHPDAVKSYMVGVDYVKLE